MTDREFKRNRIQSGDTEASGQQLQGMIGSRRLLCAAMFAALVVTGCGDQVCQPAAGELAAFEMVTPAGPSIDMDRVAQARIPTGPYRVVPGDTLQLDMLSVLDPQSLRDVATAGKQEFKYRVDDTGAILLPIVGHFVVVNKSLTEIEASIVAAYFPKYVKVPFPVHAAVVDYDTCRVSIVGAVAKPGIYALRRDEMSLVALLMEAGGISEKGAAVIRITHRGREKTGPHVQADHRGFEVALANAADTYRELPTQRLAMGQMEDRDQDQNVATLVLPVKGLNIPFVDAALEEGDHVVVEWPQEQFVSVVGLVNRPGSFPYPPTAHFTLIQAVGFAGGLELVADPRYISVYRLQSDGTIARITVQLVNPKDRDHLTDALALLLRPGDVVSVEHTPRTRANVFFERIFRINLGLYLNPDDFWRND